MHSSRDTSITQRGAGLEERRREAAATAVLVAAVSAVLLGGLMVAARGADIERVGAHLHEPPPMERTLRDGF